MVYCDRCGEEEFSMIRNVKFWWTSFRLCSYCENSMAEFIRSREGFWIQEVRDWVKKQPSEKGK